MRVHELAKELNVSSRELLDKLAELGIEVKTASSALDEYAQQVARDAVEDEREEEDAPESEEAEIGEGAAEPETPAPAADEPAPAAPAAAPAPVAVADRPAPPPEPAAPAATPPPPTPAAPAPPKQIVLSGPMTVRDLATHIGAKPNQLIAELMQMNIFATISQALDPKVIRRIAEAHHLQIAQPPKAPKEPKKAPPPPPKPKPKKQKADAAAAPSQGDQPRPPIVTFLGHVDHGKTSLLDRIRNDSVAAREDGGITQHMGAYSVMSGEHSITFLDTPGHAAFTAMRARGANVTDIAVVVIAADDGIMPQTKEAIQHARAAGVCIMVAINKIDLNSANVDRVKKQLQQEGLNPEDWGGDIICCPVSATSGEGMDHLLEMIRLQADMLELRADPGLPAQGYVVEARLEPGMGPTATMLVRNGTLKVGDAVVCDCLCGKIKALINDKGVRVRTAGPSTPVKITGLTNVPNAGDELQVVPSEREARTTAAERAEEQRKAELARPRRASLEDLMNAATSGDEMRELRLIVKADVKGSLEAIEHALGGITSRKVKVDFVLMGVGNVTDNDVLLASASNAIIVGFHVGADASVGKLARHEGVEIRLYSIIYELIDQVREAMTGMLEPETREKNLGVAEVRQVFAMSKRGNVAGCMVIQGRISAKGRARIRRGDQLVFEGSLASLRRFQSDASEIREGQECGIRLENFNNYEVGDRIECYEIEKLAVEL